MNRLTAVALAASFWHLPLNASEEIPLPRQDSLGIPKILLETLREPVEAVPASDENNELPVSPVADFIANHADAVTSASFENALRLLDQNDLVGAASEFEASLVELERLHDKQHLSLLPPLQGIAAVRLEQGDLYAAQEALLRAQNITHQQGGVFAAAQLPILSSLEEMAKQNKDVDTVYRLNLFYLKIHEISYGSEDARLIPALIKLGKYLTRRSARMKHRPDHRMLFDESIDMYKKAATLIEQHYGPYDHRLIEPLEGIAKGGTMNGMGKDDGVAALERVIGVVRHHWQGDVDDVARAQVKLADYLNLWKDPRASEKYLVAWHAIPSDPAFDSLRQSLFDEPVRIQPVNIHLSLRRRPDSATGDRVYTELEFLVKPDGSVRRIKVVGGNVPNKVNRQLRAVLARSKYRPRIRNGELVRAERQHLVYDFKVD